VVQTHWDKIYQNHQRGGEAYASLGHEILPAFIRFIRKSHFPIKSAFDIGVGDGRYLKFLQTRKFKVVGIDNSQIAIKISKRILSKGVRIILADMYNYLIPRGRYDLIFSVATMQHGFKKQIQQLVKRIYNALINSGKIFITLPRLDSPSDQGFLKTHRILVPGTITPKIGPEAGLPHSIYTKVEVKKLFSKFRHLSIKKGKYHCWNITAEK